MENGDLIPLIIAVSVPHYAQVLAQYDFALVAAALGFLIDIGHYRTIKVFLKGKGAGWMIVLTMFSFGFHTAFYALGGAGLWAMVIGAAVPAVIFALSFISRAERLDVKAARITDTRPKSQSQSQPKSQLGTSDSRIRTYQELVAFNMGNDGKHPLTAAELREQHGISKSTAYRWAEDYKKGKRA